MMMMIHSLLAVMALTIALFSAPSWTLDNGLARRPPMGWMAWERFTCETDCHKYPADCVSSRLFYEMADRLVDDGYRSLGYRYLNIDDCWSEMERHNGELVPNRTRFPENISGLANYVHAKGLYLGLYGDCGYKTCGGYPAQLKPTKVLGQPVDVDPNQNYFQRDASSLQDWQVDAFKFDGCYIEPREAEHICPFMAEALKANFRPVLLTCEWPFYMMYAHAEPNYTLAGESCNAWRYYDDIEDSWLSILNTIDYTVKHQSTILKYHGPGHWFDPDQLVIGNFGLSRDQEMAQMAIWSIWSAPLLMSNDLRAIPAHSAKLLKNRHLIEVNQDPLGVWGQMVGQQGEAQAFVKPMMPLHAATGCPSFAVVYLNRATIGKPTKVSFKLRDLLTGAPIFQAARNLQAALLGPTRQSPRIDAAGCLSWLRKAMSGQQADWLAAPMERQQVRFQVVDLFEDGSLPQEVSLNGELELRVNPSGVRAIRLFQL